MNLTVPKVLVHMFAITALITQLNVSANCVSPKDKALAAIKRTPSPKEYCVQPKSISVLYAIAEIASKRPQTSKCYHELNQIYDGIHQKEVWALKGKIATVHFDKSL